MQIKKKTPSGTISASQNEYGIDTGLYLHDSAVSLEYSEKEKGLVMLLNKDVIEQDKIKVIYVDRGWNPVE